MLRRATRAFAEDKIALEEGLRWGSGAAIAPIVMWDEEHWHTVQARQLQFVREAGLLSHLPRYLNGLCTVAVWRGDFAAAAALIAEVDAIAEATGTGLAAYSAVLLAGFRGQKPTPPS
jgi:hypothetical protein